MGINCKEFNEQGSNLKDFVIIMLLTKAKVKNVN